MRRSRHILFCFSSIFMISSSTSVVAEDASQSYSISEKQITLWDIEAENNVIYDLPKDPQKEIKGKSKNINGEWTQLDSTDEVTKYHVGSVKAPKENKKSSIVDVPSTRLYRLYNPNSGEHFYTSNPIECQMIMQAG
ncbi:hypothetical protein [Enterococcus gilvus]|uniref:hypothetical protein n=1 Tax=Enterococcus gilvus TaxID=160453 RepID=UPI0028D55D69|nr:hypothetical protein [Enterococcus gilvus]